MTSRIIHHKGRPGGAFGNDPAQKARIGQTSSTKPAPKTTSLTPKQIDSFCDTFGKKLKANEEPIEALKAVIRNFGEQRIYSLNPRDKEELSFRLGCTADDNGKTLTEADALEALNPPARISSHPSDTSLKHAPQTQRGRLQVSPHTEPINKNLFTIKFTENATDGINDALADKLWRDGLVGSNRRFNATQLATRKEIKGQRLTNLGPHDTGDYGSGHLFLAFEDGELLSRYGGITLELLPEEPVTGEDVFGARGISKTGHITAGNRADEVTLSFREDPSGKLTTGKSYLVFCNERPELDGKSYKLHNWDELGGIYYLEFESGKVNPDSGNPFLFMFKINSTYTFKEVSS